MELVCDACGEANPAGTEFCRNCNAFLAWDRSVLQPRAGQSAPVRPAPSGPLPPRPAPVAPHAVGPPVADPAAWPTEPIPAYDPGYPPQPYPPAAYGTPVDPYGWNGTPMSAGSAPPVYATEYTCPTCGRVNPATRRFCSRCGYGFATSVAPNPNVNPSWWAANQAAQDRAARRAYRRSLPPLYRWRRVLITVLVLALGASATVVLHRDPVGIAKAGWYALNNRYVTVNGVQAKVLPDGFTAANANASALVDRSVNEWTANWAPSDESACGAAGNTGIIVLTFPPTWIRQLQIVPGLDKSNPQRDLQPLPKDLGVSFDNDRCRPVQLKPDPSPETIRLDSERPVTSIQIGIGSAYPSGPDAARLISITEIILKSFPS